MQYYQTKARCPECSLFFKYAVSEEELEEELGQEVFCPRCGETAVFGPYQPCSLETYEEIIEVYEEYEESELDLDDFDDLEEEDEDEEDW